MPEGPVTVSTLIETERARRRWNIATMARALGIANTSYAEYRSGRTPWVLPAIRGAYLNLGLDAATLLQADPLGKTAFKYNAPHIRPKRVVHAKLVD